MADKAAMLADREAGMMYKQIAEKHGVSAQYVAFVCSKYSSNHFRHVSETGCIYPNWRRWVNENKISKNEMLRRMGQAVVARNSERLREVMKGEILPRKDYIDKLLTVTGMSYEMLFSDTLWRSDDEE
jgi:hypothetical protein